MAVPLTQMTDGLAKCFSRPAPTLGTVAQTISDLVPSAKHFLACSRTEVCGKVE